MKYQKILHSVFACCVLTACAPVPDFNAAPQMEPQNVQKINAYLGNVSVVIAPTDELLGYIAPSLSAITPAWQGGVVDILKRTDIFQAGATQEVNVEVKIIKLDSIQNTDLSTTSQATAMYRVVDAITHDVLWVRGISSTGTVPYKEQPNPESRERISLNLAVQNNIIQFVLLYANGSID